MLTGIETLTKRALDSGHSSIGKVALHNNVITFTIVEVYLNRRLSYI